MARRGVTTQALPHAKWSVMWVAKGRIFERKTDYNLAEAVRLHALLTKADKKGVTLRCCNMGFPPPVNVLEHEEEHYEKRKVRKGKHKGKTVYVRTVTVVNKMHELNLEGVWWCPFCMKFRRFKQTVWDDKHLMQCPMCDITTRNWHVARWNPLAWSMQARKKK